ncbi:MAG TPA: hypothetical protein VF194_17945 [Ferrovibrio sp.]|uniref:hypothetical protein n=1 Tax=Ferrovibrio sp. TaxID=1917215 RepID=UPI002ED2961C
MPILIILLLAVMVAQFGFWNTLAGLLGGIGIFVLVVVTGLALLAAIASYALRRIGRGG